MYAYLLMALILDVIGRTKSVAMLVRNNIGFFLEKLAPGEYLRSFPKSDRRHTARRLRGLKKMGCANCSDYAVLNG